MKFLPEEIYSFFGYQITIVSNSLEVLAHIRSVYSKFFQNKEGLRAHKNIEEKNKSRITVKIIDNLDTSNEYKNNQRYISNGANKWYYRVYVHPRLLSL